jgi:hypothetical protein
MINLVKLTEYFDIYSGIEKNKVLHSDLKINQNYIPYIRPSNEYNGTFNGFVDKVSCNKSKIYPKETIFYGNTGEGCHTFAYVSQSEFVPNNNVSVLISKIDLLLEEKLFYAKCITSNRYRFSYGRIPNLNRMANLLIPSKESIPKFVYNKEIPVIFKTPLLICDELDLDITNWRFFKLNNIFEMYAGKYYNPDSYKEGKTHLISSSEKNNGVIEFTDLEPKYDNCLTIGKIGITTFYQSMPFIATSDVTILTPKINIPFNQYIGLFIASIINLEKYKWSYGRQIRLNDCQKLSIKLPATPEGLPDWQFMEKYIKSLPYSSLL